MKNKLIAVSALLAGMFASCAQAAPDCAGVPAPYFQKAREIKWVWNEALKTHEHLVCGDAVTPGKPFVQMLKFPPNYVGKRHSHPIDRVVMLQSGKWISTTYDGPNGAAVAHVIDKPNDYYYESADYEHSFVTGSKGAIITVLGWDGPNKRNDPKQ